MSIRWLLLATLLLVSTKAAASNPDQQCYDQLGRAKACFPTLINAAYDVDVHATNTCGVNGESTYTYLPSDYMLSSSSREYTEEICKSQGAKSHGPELCVDGVNSTYWQSDTLNDVIGDSEGSSTANDPSFFSVNITLDLSMTVEVFWVHMTFKSPRPHSLVLYRRNSHAEPWRPLQYFSEKCVPTFNMWPKTTSDLAGEVIIQPECDQSQSDIIPMKNGEIIYEPLKKWSQIKLNSRQMEITRNLSARYLMISFVRVHTFGDIYSGSSSALLKRYYYTLGDVSVGGRCQCHGHAGGCDSSDPTHKACRCEHGTAGVDCGHCLPLFNDQPWRSALGGEGSDQIECRPCECNGLADACVFDESVWRANNFTGGGVCVHCRNNTTGNHCERCKLNHFRDPTTGACIPCNCHPIGSASEQCSSMGVCLCLPGVEGAQCDRCKPDYYQFSEYGCRRCECDTAGTVGGVNKCSQDGLCDCKENVIGDSCSQCLEGHFNLSPEDEFGCQSCFCFNHAATCTADSSFSQKLISELFDNMGEAYSTSVEGWRAETLFGRSCSLVVHSGYSWLSIDSSPSTAEQCRASRADSAVYYLLPDRFLGDQKLSYNRYLTFNLKSLGSLTAPSSGHDLILRGVGQQGQVIEVMAGIESQGNPPLGVTWQTYRFKLHEKKQWDRQLTSLQFQTLLANLTKIAIRGVYGEASCNLDSVTLQSAQFDLTAATSSSRPRATVEACDCLPGYAGQFCQQCARGHRRNSVVRRYGSPLDECVPCQCNGHSVDCDPESGVCVCGHHTTGDNCERCLPGYLGDPTSSPSSPADACQPCPCPEVMTSDGDVRPGMCGRDASGGGVVCVECPAGYTGDRCQECSDGYYQRPSPTLVSPPPVCVPCDCNGNTDPHGVNTCDRRTGVCHRCVNNTTGDHCERCLPDHFGSALAHPATCAPCECDERGTAERFTAGQSCSPRTGSCICKRNVVGRRCDQCTENHFGLASGQGCSPCECDPTGSRSPQCDVTSGQCPCLPHVSTRDCSVCDVNTFGLNNRTGCEPCRCHPHGVTGGRLQCDERGVCGPCRDRVTGDKCDRCVENHYQPIGDDRLDCPECGYCYSLVQAEVDSTRMSLMELQQLLEDIANKPIQVTDDSFRGDLLEVLRDAELLLIEAQRVNESTVDLTANLQTLRELSDEITMKLADMQDAHENMVNNNQTAADKVASINRTLDHIHDTMDGLDRDVSQGETMLETIEAKAEELKETLSELHKLVASAEALADVHNDTVNELVIQTDDSEFIAKEVLRLVQMVKNFDQSMTGDIGQIKTNVDNVNFEELRKEFMTYFNNTWDAYQKTLELYSRASDPVPDYDVQPYLDAAAEMDIVIGNLGEELDALIDEVIQLNSSSENIRDETNALIDQATFLKNELTKDMLSLYFPLKDLQNLANETTEKYNVGLANLNHLKEHQTNSSSSIASLDSEFGRMPGIRANVSLANERSTAARAEVAEYGLQVASAVGNSNHVLNESRRELQEAEGVLASFERMAGDVTSERREVAEIMADIEGQRARIQRFLDTLNNDVRHRQNKASNDATQSANKLHEAVLLLNETTALVDQLETSVNRLAFFSPEELSQFDRTMGRLTEISAQFHPDEVARQVGQLEDRSRLLDDDLAKYEAMYRQLLDDVANAEEIAESVKVICNSINTPIT